MIDLKTVLANNREAVADFLNTASALAPSDWGRPRAPGKWSPGQVTEHVALTYEVSRRILHGTTAEGEGVLRSVDLSDWNRDHGVRHGGSTITIRNTMEELIADYDHHRKQIERCV